MDDAECNGYFVYEEVMHNGGNHVESIADESCDSCCPVQVELN